ncbi:MAG: hypothetical protein ACRBCS_14965 [Cellvibrionaceae bacterium]
MLKSKVYKLVDFFTPEGTCECCGINCKTALCNTCREELLNTIDESPTTNNVSEELIAEVDPQKLSA